MPVADNIAKGEVVEVSGQQATEFRVQLVAPPDNLPKTLYNPNDMCASGRPSGNTAEAASSTCFWSLTWSFTEAARLTCTGTLAMCCRVWS